MQAVGRYFPLGFALILAIILADQYTKWLVTETMLRMDGAPAVFFDWFTTVKKIPFFITEREHFKTMTLAPFLDFVVVWNQGISFGLMDTHSPKMSLAFIALSLTISLGMLLWLVLAERKSVALALSLIVGGALGNVIDRVRFGAVADFIDVHAGALHWPAFNLADSCIFLGAAVLILDSFLNKRQENT